MKVYKLTLIQSTPIDTSSWTAITSSYVNKPIECVLNETLYATRQLAQAASDIKLAASVDLYGSNHNIKTQITELDVVDE